MLAKYLVKDTMYISFVAQVVTLLIGLSAQFVNLSNTDIILKQALALENSVQFIEGCFYLFFIFFYINNVDKTDIAKYRYYDWILTTPTMILSTIIYFEYNNQKKNNKIFTFFQFIKENYYKIIELFSYNFGMLFVGYLQEISLINITISTIVGFTFFILLFYKMYEYYASKTTANMPIFIIMTTIWSIYGIAALFDFKVKNAFYNILDVFSKNFYGLFLAYLVYSLGI